MSSRKACLLLALSLVASAASAKVVSVEIAASTGPQATAHQKWLQRFNELGVSNVRIRGASGREEPRVEEFGEPGRPMTKLHGVLARGDVLLLPGGKFKLSQRQALADYLARLDAEGAEEFMAPRGQFGLKRDEFERVFSALTAPLGRLDEGATLGDAVRTIGTELPLAIEPAVERLLAADAEGAQELAIVSRGAALALLLRQEGLALAPHKPIGGEVELRIIEAHSAKETWPVGYKPERSPRETAPVLFEFLTVEINGYSLEEALAAIGPRLIIGEAPLPILWDRFALRSERIDPSAVQVTFKPKRTYYLRIIDRLAFQARLKTELLVDESGRPFLLLTR